MMSLTLEQWGVRLGGGYRTLYHIGRNLPIAQPKNVSHWADRGQPGEEWVRPGRPPIRKGVFLTDKKGLMGVRTHHGVLGNVYIYRVPNGLIREAGGMRRYDHAREVLFSESQWDQIKRSLIGKIDGDKFEAWIRDEGAWSEARDQHRVERKRRQQERAQTRRAGGPKFKNKKQVDKADGSGKTTVYEYSERQVDHRNREKANRIDKLQSDMSRVREKYRSDLKSDDPKKRLTALAVALIDQTYERVGNEKSAQDNKHYGVTTLNVGHVSLGKGKATLRYTGKSGVEHEKVVTDAKVVALLRELVRGRKAKDHLLCDDATDCNVRARNVNDYLREFGVTAKDLRGFHANAEMQKRLRKVRNQGGKLPADTKEREKALKGEFKQALEEVAALVGHKSSTLKSQYLVPGMEDSFLKDGTVLATFGKKAALPFSAWGDFLVPFEKAGTKSDAEREDEEVRKLIRKSPKKKPPRRDLEKRRVEDEDTESDPDKAQEEKDTSHNWKTTASLEYSASVVAARRLISRYLEGTGSYKPSTRSKGKFRATNPEGQSKTVDSEAEAKTFAGLDDEGGGEDGEGGGPKLPDASSVDFNDDQAILDYAKDVAGGFAHVDVSEVQDMVLDIWADSEDFSSEDAQKALKEKLVDTEKERKDQTEKDEADRERETKFLKTTDALRDSSSFGTYGFDIGDVDFDGERQEVFMKAFGKIQDKMKSRDLSGVSPVSAKDIKNLADTLTSTRSSKKDDLLADPEKLAEALAKIHYYDLVISNPSMIDRSNPVSDEPGDREEISDAAQIKKIRQEGAARSNHAFSAAKRLTSEERTEAVERIESELRDLPENSKRALELGAVRRGMQVAEALEQGDSSRGTGGSMLTVLKVLDKAGKMDIIFNAGLGGVSESGGGDLQSQVMKAFESVSDNMWSELVPEDHPAAELADILSDREKGQYLSSQDRKYMRELLSRQITQDLVVLDPLAVSGGGATAGEAGKLTAKARRQALGDSPSILELLEEVQEEKDHKGVLEKVEEALMGIASATADLLGFGKGKGSGSGKGKGKGKGKGEKAPSSGRDKNKPFQDLDVPASQAELEEMVEDAGLTTRKKKDLTPAQKKQEFLKDAPPEMRKRVQEMTPQEFMGMLSAIADEEDGGGAKTAYALGSAYSLVPWGRVSLLGGNSAPSPFR